MEYKTQLHIAAAERNHALASEILFNPPPLSPEPFEWVVVVAFYSTLHYANAYLWERHRFETNRHAERGQRLAQDSDWLPVDPDYRTLRSWSETARYTPLSRFSGNDAQQAVDLLCSIEGHVRSLLKLPSYQP